jgi:hypothetical protein
MKAVLTWLGCLPWKDVISVVFSATGIGIAIVTLRMADRRAKHDARSKKVRDFTDRCQKFLSDYMDFADSQRTFVLYAFDALKTRLATLSMGASILEVMNKELHGEGNPLVGHFLKLNDVMKHLCIEYFNACQGIEREEQKEFAKEAKEVAFLEYQAKVGFQANALMTIIDEYVVQGRVGTPVPQGNVTGDERTTLSK